MANQVGETIRLTATITDVDEEAINPTTVKISINKPDGAQALPATSMVNPSIGSYHYDYLAPSVLGTYAWNVTAIGSGGRVTIAKDMFSIDEAV